MLKKGKKALFKATMKLISNEKVAKTLMAAIQKKNEINEKLARFYEMLQLPSLADHESVAYAIDSVRRRIKDLEKDLWQAENAIEKVESTIERKKSAQETAKPQARPKTLKKRAAPKARPKAEPTAGPKKQVKKKIKATPKTKKKSAPKPKTRTRIAPLGAAGRKKPSAGGLLDLDFKK